MKRRLRRRRLRRRRGEEGWGRTNSRKRRRGGKSRRGCGMEPFQATGKGEGEGEGGGREAEGKEVSSVKGQVEKLSSSSLSCSSLTSTSPLSLCSAPGCKELGRSVYLPTHQYPYSTTYPNNLTYCQLRVTANLNNLPTLLL